MNRKIFSALMSVAWLLVSLSVVVSADPPDPPKTPPGKPNSPPGLQKDKDSNRHGVFGTVKSKASSTFTVTTKQGDVIVAITNQTRFHIPRKKDATFADVQVGDRVAANGTPTETGLTAKKVSVAPGKPTTQHRVGIVKEYLAGKKIVIEDVKGGTAAFTLTAQTEIRNPKASGVEVGDRVTIVSRSDPSSEEFTATAIIVHPK